MIWWTVGGIVALALILLAVVALGTVRRLAGLRVAMQALQATQGRSEAMLTAVATLQETTGFLQARAQRVQAHMQAIKSARQKPIP